MRPSAGVSPLTVSLALLLAAPFTVDECVAASDEGQQLRQAGTLLAAKQKFDVCSDLSCPKVVQAACTKWLDETITATPSLIIVARVDGADQSRVRVLLDGLPWLEELNGKPQPVDPGEHRVTVVVEGPPLEQRLVVNLGEKNRLVVFQLQSPAAGAAAFVAANPAPPPVVVGARPVPVVPLVLSGLAVVGFASFTGMGLAGRASQEQLVNSECGKARTCNPATVASLQRLYFGADLALAVGIATAGVAIWRWWAWALPGDVSAAPLLTPGKQGGAGVVLLFQMSRSP